MLVKGLEKFDLPIPVRIAPLAGGANNRVFKLEFMGRSPLVYKEYFQHPNDTRPRLKTEFSFLEYVWKLGIRNVPQPLQADLNGNSALYSFLPGIPVQIGEVNEALIGQMLSFFRLLNQNRSEGLHLPNASEACFSIADYLRITEERVQRLLSAADTSFLEGELDRFVFHDLLPSWDRIKCKTALHLPEDRPLPIEDRCISPSDFGFHNALNDSGDLSFIDFEYAGWDDGCKTVCDLFCQPRVPLPLEYFPLAAKAIAETGPRPEDCLKRILIIFPVIQIKWCCIILNVFTNVGKIRRLFSESAQIEFQSNQLKMAKTQLEKIKF